jgi:dihydrofolate reductase
MARIVISTNTSLDRVVQDPDGTEGFEHGGWFTRHGATDREPWAELTAAEAFASTALLLGRRSDAWFASRWLGRDGAWAARLNAMPKYVVSSHLEEPHWSNASVIGVDEVAGLKRTLDGDIVVYASYDLSRALLDRDLVDEVRLFVFPVIVGAGERLFGDAGAPTALALRECRTVGEQLTFVRYDVVHPG